MPYDSRNVAASVDSCVSHGRNDGPRGCCIHTSGGTSSLEWLSGGSCKAGSPAGADALIQRDGTRYILTDAKRFAYHAGVSYVYNQGPLYGDEVSEAYFGIELECTDDQAPTYEQYDSLAELVALLALVWGWRWPYTIYGHYAVARPLGRRSDPVNFDWGAFMGRLYVHSLSNKVPGLVD